MKCCADVITALEAAKDELIRLYEERYPDDESDNETTRVIDHVIQTIEKTKKQ